MISAIDQATLLALEPAEKLRLAKLLAANIGYQLVRAEKVSAAEVDAAIELWNAMAKATQGGNPEHKLALVRKLNPANRKHLAARLGEFGPEGWRLCVEAVFKSAHCRGINDRGWRADISYLLQPKGSNKAVNGGWPADYKEKSRDGQRTGPAGRGDKRLDGLRSFDAAIRGRLAQSEQRGGGGEEGRQGSGADARGYRRLGHRLALGPPADGG